MTISSNSMIIFYIIALLALIFCAYKASRYNKSVSELPSVKENDQ